MKRVSMASIDCVDVGEDFWLTSVTSWQEDEIKQGKLVRKIPYCILCEIRTEGNYYGKTLCIKVDALGDLPIVNCGYLLEDKQAVLLGVSESYDLALKRIDATGVDLKEAEKQMDAISTHYKYTGKCISALKKAREEIEKQLLTDVYSLSDNEILEWKQESLLYINTTRQKINKYFTKLKNLHMSIDKSIITLGGFGGKYKPDVLNKQDVLTWLDNISSESISSLDKLEGYVNYYSYNSRTLGNYGFFNYLNMHLNFTSLIDNISGCVESECITGYGVLNASGIPHLIPAFTGQVIPDDIKPLSIIKEDANAFNCILVPEFNPSKNTTMKKLEAAFKLDFIKKSGGYTLLRSGNKKTFIFSGSIGCITSDTSGTKGVSVSNRGIYLFNTHEFVLTQEGLQKLFDCNIFNSSLSTVSLRLLKDKTLKKQISSAKHFNHSDIGKMYLKASVVNKKVSRNSNTLYEVTVYELLKLADRCNGTVEEADEIIRNFYR